MVRKHKHTNKYVLTGCTNTPSSKNPFCPEHQTADTPVILAEKLSNETRQKLLKYRENTATTPTVNQDSVFIVEKVLKMRGDFYLVKFNGFPEEEASWENESHIPPFIRSFYSKKTNLKKNLPAPTLGKQIKVGN